MGMFSKSSVGDLGIMRFGLGFQKLNSEIEIFGKWQCDIWEASKKAPLARNLWGLSTISETHVHLDFVEKDLLEEFGFSQPTKLFKKYIHRIHKMIFRTLHLCFSEVCLVG